MNYDPNHEAADAHLERIRNLTPEQIRARLAGADRPHRRGDDPFRAIHPIARRCNMALMPGRRAARGLGAATGGSKAERSLAFSLG